MFIDVRERRLDLRRPAFAGVFRPRALPRLLQIDVSTSTAQDHSNIPCQRNAWQGRLNVRSIVAFRSSSRRRYAGSGAEDHRILGAPSRDCSRERLRPDPDRFRLLASRSLRVTLPGGGEGGQAKPPASRHASKAWATTGPRHARPPRRDSTCGCPRGLPSQGRPRTGMDSRGRSRSIVVSSAFFTAGEPCEGRSHGAGQPGLSIRETANRPVID